MMCRTQSLHRTWRSLCRGAVTAIGVIAFVSLCHADDPQPATDGGGISVAVFDVDATPPIGFVMAYDPVRAHGEIGLRCRGIVILGAGKPIVLCAVDWIGIGNESQDIFRARIAKAAGTVASRVAVHTLHQHDAPRSDFTAEALLHQAGVSNLGAYNGSFARQLLDRLGKAIQDAVANPTPVTHAGFGSAEVRDVASNRRIQDADGQVVATRYTATKDKTLRDKPVGVIDPMLNTLSFFNGKKPVAVLSYYACHPQSYYRTGIPSPDFPGLARFLRSQDAPGPLYIHFNGAGGNVGAGKYNDGNPKNRMLLAGRLAAGMEAAWDATKRFAISANDVAWDFRGVELPPAKHLELNQLKQELTNWDGVQYWGSPDKLAWLLRCQSGTKIDVGCLRVGNVRVLHMPGELFVEYQLNAKKLRPDLDVAMAAYGDYGPGYIGTSAAYAQGGYETSQPASNVGPETEPILMQAVEQLLDADFSKELTRAAPLEVPAALRTFKVAEGFEMQAVASEPLISSPVEIQWDATGAMFVCQMRGYSENRDDQLSSIVRLTDTDGDGVYDKSSVYAKDLFWPTGIFPYDSGLFVADAPDLWYFKDTDGDGVADTKQLVLTGFGTSNVQGLVNSLRWGLDNRIHIACSSAGGAIRHAHDDQSQPALNIRGRDLVLDPRTLQFQPSSGAAQHGMSFDDWGHKFVSSNSDHIQQVMYDERFIARNPYLIPPPSRISIAADGPQAEVFRTSPVEPWRIVRTRLRVSGRAKGPIEGGGRAAGYFTGATGVTIYRGDAWPDQSKGLAIVGDVGSNLIHRKRLDAKGVEFVARRIDEQSELVTSTDIWFRPAQFANAPDGSLHVVDMYREVIEHPASLPPSIKRHLDLTAGRDRGRIYRIVPVGFQTPAASSARPTDLSVLSTGELVALLAHPNAWHRETAARLLYQRQDKRETAALRRMAQSDPSALGRLHALSALDGLNELDQATVIDVINDSHPQVRRHGVRLASVLPWSAELASALDQRLSDPSIEVRYQLAFALGEFPRLAPEQRGERLKTLLAQDPDNRWLRMAVLSSIRDPREIAALRSIAASDDGLEKTLADLAAGLGSGKAMDRQPAHSLLETSAMRVRSAAELAERDRVIDRYRKSTASLDADPLRGRQLFEKTCSTCHQVGAVGRPIGPNLMAFKNRGIDAWLTSVLDPNREVNPLYVTYVIITVDGRVLSGMIIDEGANSLTLRASDGSTNTVLRIDIDEIKNTQVSLMPAGLETILDEQAMRDLIEYLITCDEAQSHAPG